MHYCLERGEAENPCKRSYRPLVESLEDRQMPASFTANDLVVSQVGDGVNTLSTTARAVNLKEYSTSGTLVQTIALPTSVSGSNQKFTLSGTNTQEGQLSLSPSGQVLTLAGFDASPGTTNVDSTSSSSTNRIVAIVGTSGTIDINPATKIIM